VKLVIGEHFVAERGDEEQKIIDFRKKKTRAHFFGDSAAQAIGLHKIDGGERNREFGRKRFLAMAVVGWFLDF